MESLKNYIQNQRKEFDQHTPSSEHWNGITEKLQSKKNSTWFIYRWQIAAGIAVIVGCWVYFTNRPVKEQEEYFSLNVPVDTTYEKNVNILNDDSMQELFVEVKDSSIESKPKIPVILADSISNKNGGTVVVNYIVGLSDENGSFQYQYTGEEYQDAMVIHANKGNDFWHFRSSQEGQVFRESLTYEWQYGWMEDPNTEKYMNWVENPETSPLDAPLSTFSIDVDGASYSLVRNFLNNGQIPIYQSVKVEEMVNYLDYDYMPPSKNEEHPLRVYTEYRPCPWNVHKDLLKVTIQAKEVEKDVMPASNLVFLVDVSGSMEDEGKLDLIKKSFRYMVRNLRPADKVSIVTYAGYSGVVLPPTSGSEKETIMDAIKSLKAMGSTNGESGILTAYKLCNDQYLHKGNNRVILATDGDFNVGVSSDNELQALIEEKRKEGIFLTVLGFGEGNYQGEKMEILADNGNGNYFYMDGMFEGKKVFDTELSSTLLTVAKDAKIQIEFNPKFVKNYRLVGYENRLLEDEDFENDAIDGGDLGAGDQVTAFYEITPADGSEELSNKDLKYQQKYVPSANEYSDELATVEFRYKHPKGHISKLITTIQKAGYSEKNSEFELAASVAECSMVLRESAFKNDASLDHVLQTLIENHYESRSVNWTNFYDMVVKAKNLRQAQ